MSTSVVIVANGISRENMRLQPWRYLYEIAVRIAHRHDTILVTEGNQDREEESWGDGRLRILRTRWLSVRHQRRLGRLIENLEPAQVWWSVTPRTVAYWPMLRRMSCDLYALITCPLYEYRQLVRASLAGVPFEELGVLWKQRLIPRRLFAGMLGRGLFRKVFVQSEANRRVLLAAGVFPARVSLLRVGIDAQDRAPVERDALAKVRAAQGDGPGAVRFLYFGAVRRIRGFDALLKAFTVAAALSPEARLVVLARGADEDKLGEIRNRLQARGLSERVDLVGGWLSREEVWGHIEASDAAVLPFVIVPSDIPIAILEAMARGRPVIGTPIDGIPELIEGRGMVVDPLDTGAFAQAMVRMTEDSELRSTLGTRARDYMQSYPDWNEVGDLAMREAALA